MMTKTTIGQTFFSLVLASTMGFAESALAQVKIGVGAPISGGSAAFGAQLRNGVEQAVADINSTNGILGQKLMLFIGDDRADPKDGVVVANKFVAEGVNFVIGHFNSGVTIPASDIYQQNHVLMITPSSSNPTVTDRNLWNVFRICGRDDQQGVVAGTIIAQKFAGKRIAILHDKTTYGQKLAEETRKAMKAKGVKEVIFEGVERDKDDFAQLVSRVIAMRPDLVYWGGLHDTGGLILHEIRSRGLTALMMAGDGISDSEFAAIAGPGAEGTLMTSPPDPRLNPTNKELVKTFRVTRGFEPQGYTLYSYAAIQLIKQASEQAKSLDPQTIAQVMHSGRAFSSVLGDISFNAKGDIYGYTVAGKRRDTYVLYTWKKGSDGTIAYWEDH
jgi:branched-chain amino acid transport system substrate-binding protein